LFNERHISLIQHIVRTLHFIGYVDSALSACHNPGFWLQLHNIQLLECSADIYRQSLKTFYFL